MPRLRFLVAYLVFLYLFAVLAHAQAHGNSIQDHPTGSAVSNAGAPVLPNPSAVALNPIIKFTTLFGILAVKIAVNEQAAAPYLAAFFTFIGLVFVWRSFYSMRIGEEE